VTEPYGSTVLDHFRRPRNQRALARPTAAHESCNPLCGDRVRVEIEVNDALIADVAFTANACAICTASASLFTERVRGMSVHAASSVTDDDVVHALKTEIPPARVACAVLPAQAFRSAVAQLAPA
jgi:nitrogen fixation protein NifU and related proteins